MDKSSTYCVMPHLGMAVQNESDFCCCNVNKESWQDPNRETIHVYSHPLERVYKSHTRKMIAAGLDHGRQLSSCQVCWDLESAGQQSARQRFNQQFGHLEPISTQPRILVIKPGNTCNFACRMCNPVTSSNWYHDGIELEKAGLTSVSWYAEPRDPDTVAQLSFNEYTRTFETVRNSFNSDNKEFWSTLKDWMSGLVYIDIYGGEPFLIPAMFDLLQHGIDIGASSNIKLNIHTNASIFNQKYLEILSQYQQVNFNVSIDSMSPAELEYIRHRANFDTVIQNTQRFKEILQAHNNVKMNITCTITPLNVFYVDQIVEQLQDQFSLPVSVNIVTTPEYDIRHLPPAIKTKLINTLTTETVVNFLKQTIPGCDIEWPRFCRTTNLLDRTRAQQFSNVFPDWWTLLKPYWVY
jgi:MoaA/NifB/PqqE/SkfB family radical SAM enzyme